MKKMLATVLAAAAICGCTYGQAGAVNWQQFGQDSNGISWWIDQDSVHKDGKTATVDIKAQDSEGNHVVSTEVFNQKKKTVKETKATLFNAAGEAQQQGTVDGKDKPVVAGSPSEAVYNFLFSQQNNDKNQAKQAKNKKK